MLYEHGRKRATAVAASILVGLCLAGPAAAAESRPDAAAVTASTSSTIPGAGGDSLTRASQTITLLEDGIARSFRTDAATVGAFLLEHGIAPDLHDRLSHPLASSLSDGMTVTLRHPMPVTLIVGGARRTVTTTAATVAELLEEQHVTPGTTDDVVPARSAPLVSDALVHVVSPQRWTARRQQTIPIRTRTAYDAKLPAGLTRTLPGRSGRRDVTVQYERLGFAPVRTSIVSRIVRPAHDRVIIHGIGRIASFARLAQTGFAATIKLAGDALSMLATAYSASCSGCSGMTASGAHAGHGIVAVDPSIIPLGTRLFIPGYGRAVAGDTGGAIVGHRIDLGFDSTGDALRFGSRAITVYILK